MTVSQNTHIRDDIKKLVLLTYSAWDLIDDGVHAVITHLWQFVGSP